MGLDLHHYKIAAQTDRACDYFTLDEFIDSPGFIERHRNLIGEVQEVDQYHEILVFPDTLTKGIFYRTNKVVSERSFLIGELKNLKEQINEIASAKSFSENDLTVVKKIDSFLSHETSKQISYYSISYERKSPVIKVLFHYEIGYQRKGMNGSFYRNFVNGKLYFDKASVLKAYSYLQPGLADSKVDLQNRFKEQFINKFTEGESIFYPDW